MTRGPAAGTCLETTFDGVAEMPRQLRLLLACGTEGDVTLSLSGATARDLARVLEQGLAAEDAMRAAAAARDQARAALVEAQRIHDGNLAFARRLWRVALWAGLVTMAAAALSLAARPAAAHGFYSTYCCSGRDCAEAPAGAVVAGPDGWHVALSPGQHPMVGAPFRAVVPYGDRAILPAPDGVFHVCIVSGAVRCLYVPPMGM